MMSEKTYLVRYLIKKIHFIKIFKRSYPLSHLRTTRSLKKEDVSLIIKYFGNITIKDLINLYELSKAKILNTVRNREKTLEVWDELERHNNINWTPYEHNVSHKIYRLMATELFGGDNIQS